MKKVVDLTFAKSKEYKNVLRMIKEKGKCPFCKENFKYHKNPIEKREKDWFITKSSWPYRDTKYHFLIIPERHKENFRELNQADFKAISKLVNWAIEKYKIKGGGLTMRFGETSFSGSTVCHLHFHLISPQKGRKNKIVYFPIG